MNNLFSYIQLYKNMMDIIMNSQGYRLHKKGRFLMTNDYTFMYNVLKSTMLIYLIFQLKM